VYLACGEGLEAAAHFANAAAALKATKLGAQAGLPRREEVLRLLRRLEEDAPDNQAEVSRQA
jgi:ribokinase